MKRMNASPERMLPKTESGWYNKGTKRALDLFILASAHVLLFPMWLVLWIGVTAVLLLSQGRPIFYSQHRVGRNGRTFRAWKFRTMVKDADRKGPVWTAANDPRVTRVGHALRRTALDELPQLFNIAVGDMSFVGPRALAAAEIENLRIQGLPVDQRTRVRPGLTGLAQLRSARGDAANKIEHDIRYIESMSLVLDVKIVFLSIWHTISRKWDHG